MNCRLLAYHFYLLVFVILAACEMQAPKKDTDGLRDIIPTAELDRAPKKPKDVSQVKDAVPKFEPRTIAGNKSPYKVMGIVYRVMEDPTGYEGYGIASWYGEKFHGNRTSNGEVYDMYQMTAAHKTLPIPSYVRVTNVENGKSIIVRVNDRGPFAPGRIIDLSYAGAKKLDYIRAGTAKVKVEYIDPGTYQARDEVQAVVDENSNEPDVKAVTKGIDNTSSSPSITNKNSAQSIQAQEVAGRDLAEVDSKAVDTRSVSAEPVKQAVASVDASSSTDTSSQKKQSAISTAPIVSDWRASQRYLQVGAYTDSASANTMKARVGQYTTWPVLIEMAQKVDGEEIFRVHIGPLPDENSLQTLKRELMDKGLDEPLRITR